MFNTVARGKELEGTVKTIKKPTEENIMSEIGKLQMNHNKIGTQDFDVQSMTHSLVSGAESGSAFSGLDATLDVKKMVPEKVEVSDEEDEGEEGSPSKKRKTDHAEAVEEEEEQEETAPSKAPKKAPWVDMGKYILDKKRDLESLLNLTLIPYHESETKLRNAVQAFSAILACAVIYCCKSLCLTLL